jgi:glycosyltransferase involved in cell wall biosynthesis
MPTELPPTVTRPCITTVCGLHRRKGVPDILSAFSALSDEFPTWSLNIVGQGPDQAWLETFAKDLGLADRVRFLGQLGSPRAVLNESDIFVLASYADPCSLAVCEARFAGNAIVASAVGGTPELLRFGEAGKLVEPGRPEQIAQALRSLMADPEELASWRARSKAGADYLTLPRVARDYEAVYREVCR